MTSGSSRHAAHNAHMASAAHAAYMHLQSRRCPHRPQHRPQAWLHLSILNAGGCHCNGQRVGPAAGGGPGVGSGGNKANWQAAAAGGGRNQQAAAAAAAERRTPVGPHAHSSDFNPLPIVMDKVGGAEAQRASGGYMQQSAHCSAGASSATSLLRFLSRFSERSPLSRFLLFLSDPIAAGVWARFYAARVFN